MPNVTIEGSGTVQVLLLLLGLLERDALERGEQSLLERLAAPLRRQDKGNVVDIATEREAGSYPAQWREQALGILEMSKAFANKACYPDRVKA